jgi:hypothetical protein
MHQETLGDDVVETRTAQEGDGVISVTIPADAARDLGIQAGQNVLFVGEKGDDSLKIQPATAVFQSD